MIKKWIKPLVIVLVYIALMVAETRYVVPYERVEIFTSNQNVPHTEVLESGYTTYKNALSKPIKAIKNRKDQSTGTRINNKQLTVNLLSTTALFAFVLFITKDKKKTK